MPRLPKIVVEPLVKVAKEQWKKVLERSLEQRGKTNWNVTEKIAGQMLNKFEPPVEKEVGTLFKKRALGGGEMETAIERLPIGEARAKYFANPEQYSPTQPYFPQAKEVTTGMQGSPEELAAGLAYTKTKLAPIIPPGAKRAQNIAQKDIQQEAIGQQLKYAGVAEEDIRPGVKPEQILAEKGRYIPEKEPLTAKLARAANLADEIWRVGGGGRSMMGRAWNAYMLGGKHIEHIKTNRDYFISCFVKWTQDPVKWAKGHPREAKVMEQMRNDEALKPLFDQVEGIIK